MTPFGDAVEPDVYCRNAIASGSARSMQKPSSLLSSGDTSVAPFKPGS